MSLEQNSPRTSDKRPETWNPDNTLNAETRVPAPEHRDDKDKKGMSLKTKVGLVLAGLGIAGGGAAVSTLGGESAERAPERSPASSAPANPGEAKNQEKSSEFGISAEQYKNNPEQLAQEYYRQQNAFLIAGMDQKAAESERRFEFADDAQYISELSAPIDAKFLEAFLVDGWETNPQLSDAVANMLTIAHRTRELRMLSYNAITDEYEPYEREIVVESVDGTVSPLVTNTTYSERDNGSETTVDNNMFGQDVNTMGGAESITWTVVDGQLKISDFSPLAG